MPEPSGDIFGLGNVPDTDTGEPDPLTEDLQEPPAPEPQPEPEPEPEPEPPAEEPSPEEAAEASEEEAPRATEEGEKLFAGRYKSVEDLEKGYKNIQGEFTRARQAALEANQRVARAEQVLANLYRTVQQGQQQQLQAQAEDNPELALQMRINEMIDQRVQQALQPMQRNQQATTEQQEQVASIIAFRNRHPDIVPDSEDDVTLARVVEELQLDIGNPESLEVAYEAVKNPTLAMILRAQPQLVDSDEAMEYARQQAKLLAPGSAPAPAQGTGQATAQQQRAARPAPHVERGGSGVPPGASQQKQGDEFDEALGEWTKLRQGSVFFGSALPGTPS